MLTVFGDFEGYRGIVFVADGRCQVRPPNPRVYSEIERCTGCGWLGGVAGRDNGGECWCRRGVLVVFVCLEEQNAFREGLLLTEFRCHLCWSLF